MFPSLFFPESSTNCCQGKAQQFNIENTLVADVLKIKECVISFMNFKALYIWMFADVQVICYVSLYLGPFKIVIVGRRKSLYHSVFL